MVERENWAKREKHCKQGKFNPVSILWWQLCDDDDDQAKEINVHCGMDARCAF